MAKPDYWEEACAELSVRDPVMGQLIMAYSGGHLTSRENAFMTLARSIVGQQISVKAASSVWAKLEACLGEIEADSVLQKCSEALRVCGLSERKVSYLKDLARFSSEGRLISDNWCQKSEEEIISELILIKGIGRWTAEMFLIFYLQRPDIYPVGDIGIQKAVGMHYCDNIRPDIGKLHLIGETWRPWRTVAAWHLWRSLDPLPVTY